MWIMEARNIETPVLILVQLSDPLEYIGQSHGDQPGTSAHTTRVHFAWQSFAMYSTSGLVVPQMQYKPGPGRSPRLRQWYALEA